jgi:hypothetical protein
MFLFVVLTLFVNIHREKLVKHSSKIQGSRKMNTPVGASRGADNVPYQSYYTCQPLA